MTKSQIFFYLLIAFISGIAASSFIPMAYQAVWAFFVLGGTAAVFGTLNIKERRRLIIAGFILMLFSFGIFWFAGQNQPPDSGLESRVGESIMLSGIVDDEPARSGRSQRLIVKTGESVDKILVITRPFPEYRYGDELKISGRLERPENFSDDFDYRAYLAKDGVFLTMAFPKVEVAASGRGSRLYENLFRLKDAFAGELNRYLPEPHASFMAGLTIGERQNFPPSLRQELQATGTSHIAALSGYNITIVADAFLKTLMFFFVPWGSAFWLAVAGIMVFTALTGAAASVVRAALMGVLVLIARREGRLYGMRNALTFAGAMMLFHNPKIFRWDIAFQLSFLATLGLIYGAPILEQYCDKIKLRLIPPGRRAGLIREKRDAPRYRHKKSFLGDILISTLSAQLFVLPLLIYNFGQLSLVSPLANLAVLPLIPATMFFGFITGGLGFFSEFLGRLAGGAGWALLDYELKAIDFFSRFPYSSLEIPGFGWAALILGYGLIAAWLWREYRSKVKRK